MCSSDLHNAKQWQEGDRERLQEMIEDSMHTNKDSQAELTTSSRVILHSEAKQNCIEGCSYSSKTIVAIGEIGLDYHYDHADRKAQARCFEAQLNLAKELDLPVVVHTRDADEDTRAILANHSQYLARKGVIHSFTSSLELAEFCLAEGFLLGFNGIVTFRNADNVRSVVEATPAASIVLETDSPYLTPVPFRGRPNAPHYLPLIAEAVAEIKGMDIEPFLQLARRTSYQLFF